MSDDDTILVRTFQHRGEEPESWVKLEDVAELVKVTRALVEILKLDDDYPFYRGEVEAALKQFEGT